MIAAYRLKGIGWFGACTAIVLGFYLVSLQVASERKKLERLDADIASTRRDIRALETEFDTRANLAQLERWNGDTLALAAPQPAQFLRGEAELASVDLARGPGAPAVRTAALVVPSLSAAPPTGGAVAAAVAAAPVRTGPARTTPVRTEVAAPRPAARADAQVARVEAPGPARTAVRPPVARVAAALRPAPAAGDRPAAAGERRQVALLDRELLSDSTLRALVGGARAEGGKPR